MDIKIRKFYSGLNQRDQRYWRTLVFLLRLLILSIPFYLILSYANLFPLQVFVASSTNFILSSLGFQITQQGADLSVQATNPFYFFISPDSTGWKSMIFFFALVLAVPAVKNKRRPLALAIGLPLVFAFNLLRILSIVFTHQSYGLETAMFVHDYFFRFGLTAFVLVLWVSWYLKARE